MPLFLFQVRDPPEREAQVWQGTIHIYDVRRIFAFLDPLPPLSAYDTDLQYRIHATSLTSFSFYQWVKPLVYMALGEKWRVGLCVTGGCAKPWPR